MLKWDNTIIIFLTKGQLPPIEMGGLQVVSCKKSSTPA